MKRFLKYYRGKKGMALVWIALLLAVLLFFAATAIDISYMYYVKNQLTVAADAAALAGVAEIVDPNEPIQLNARAKAIEFSAKNTAAGISVEVVTDNTNILTNDNDITVGNWDGTTYTAGITPVNAIEVRPQRVQGLSGTRGDVRVFVGRVFRYIGINWGYLSARAEAIASYKPLPTSGINICLNTCNLTPSDEDPVSLDVRDQQAGSAFGLAWTELNQDPSIGVNRCVNNSTACVLDSSECGPPAGDNNEHVAALIWGLVPAPDVCGDYITSQNGVATVLDDLTCAFKSTSYDAENKDIVGGVVNKWRIIVPVQEKCPAGSEPGPWEVVRYAEIEIIGVFDTGQLKGVNITSIRCIECEDIYSEFGSGAPSLVK